MGRWSHCRLGHFLGAFGCVLPPLQYADSRENDILTGPVDTRVNSDNAQRSSCDCAIHIIADSGDTNLCSTHVNDANFSVNIEVFNAADIGAHFYCAERGNLRALLDADLDNTRHTTANHRSHVCGPHPQYERALMPEGDTVAWTAARLNRAMTDVILTRSDIRVPRYANIDLQGRMSHRVSCYGKHLFHHIEGGITLHSHLKMEGRWSVLPNPKTTEKKDAAQAVRRLEHSHTTRALIYTKDAVAVGSKLGVFEVIDTTQEQEIIGHLGPDILANNWSEALPKLLAQQESYLGEVLLDQRLIAGLGTMWISEMLFLYRVLPWTPMQDVDPLTLHDILQEAHTRMTMSVQRGMRASADGRLGNVHARSGMACVRCNNTIRVAMAGPRGRERTLFSCPTCQGGLAPNDDGRPQGVLKDRPRR